jgi:hypothetical protein
MKGADTRRGHVKAIATSTFASREADTCFPTLLTSHHIFARQHSPFLSFSSS